MSIIKSLCLHSTSPFTSTISTYWHILFTYVFQKGVLKTECIETNFICDEKDKNSWQISLVDKKNRNHFLQPSLGVGSNPILARRSSCLGGFSLVTAGGIGVSGFSIIVGVRGLLDWKRISKMIQLQTHEFNPLTESFLRLSNSKISSSLSSILVGSRRSILKVTWWQILKSSG